MKKFVALVSALILTVAAFAASSKVSDISQTALVSAVATKSAVILDVNGTDSYKSGHIPGAIDYIAHKDQIASLLPADKNTLVVAYCASPACTAYRAAAEAAVKLGYTNVKHYAPGISGWKQSGESVEKGG